jgi:hypothetical protein
VASCKHRGCSAKYITDNGYNLLMWNKRGITYWRSRSRCSRIDTFTEFALKQIVVCRWRRIVRSGASWAQFTRRTDPRANQLKGERPETVIEQRMIVEELEHGSVAEPRFLWAPRPAAPTEM